MIAQGHAVWITGGTPAEAEKQVRKVMQSAAFQRRVPVLVAYNLPYRDCLQYSAGGAPTTADYIAWIDGFAKGIGSGKAVVILEPDGLGIIPYNVDLQGVHEWCQPPGGSSALADARYVELNAAVDRLAQQPRASVYLDGTHSNWLGSGEAAYRLHKAGVLRTQGFFVNASNYQPTPQLVQYGTWISKCIAFATGGPPWAAGHFDWCGSQYFPATSSDYSTWHLTDEKYAAEVDPNIAGVALTHFVVDTSRNGQGPWRPTVSYPDAQDWCNPPGRGLGAPPDGQRGCAARARPAARRCVSLDQGPRRVGRILQPRDRRLDDRSGVGDRRPAGRSVVPATGAAARSAREPAAPRLIDVRRTPRAGRREPPRPRPALQSGATEEVGRSRTSAR